MSATRRGFLGSLAAAGAAAAAKRPTQDDISLAAWSLNRSFFAAKKWKNVDLPRICREEFGINGLEFVNQFFENPMMRHLNDLRKQANDYGVTLVLIMVDGEGDMAAKEAAERRQAAIAHRKWVDTAQYLGCHAIRCNLGGPRQNWKQDADLVKRSVESFRNLLDYARGAGLNVVIENHGGASSDPEVLSALMKTVDDPNFGTLPDFGNMNPGDDHAEVIRKIVPWAKGISVKARWTPDGKHQRYSLEELIGICRASGYTGFWGIESSLGPARQPGERGRPEDEGLSHEQIWANETQGVKYTKAVLDRVVLGRS